MAKTWKLRQGQVTVVEDARTASLVIVARDLKSRGDKVAWYKRSLTGFQPECSLGLLTEASAS